MALPSCPQSRRFWTFQGIVIGLICSHLLDSSKNLESFTRGFPTTEFTSRGLRMAAATPVHINTTQEEINAEVTSELEFPAPSTVPVASTQAPVASTQAPVDEDPILWIPKTGDILGSMCATPLHTNYHVAAAFPLNFEPSEYEAFGKEKYGIDSTIHLLDEAHYQSIGRKQGWRCTRGQNIRSILNEEIVPKLGGQALEIGPFLNPMLLGPDVKYFDVLDLPALKARAENIGYPSVNPVEIDYVHPQGDLSVIPSNSFLMVTSSHSVEHQFDLVRHLRAVGKLLQDGGVYLMLVPDKRYCFDHFNTESTLADVLDDFVMDVGKTLGNHKLRSVLEIRALTAHNDPVQHWAGNHGPQLNNLVPRIKEGLQEWENAVKNNNTYVDVHNYQFTPQGLAVIIDALYEMRLIDFHVHRLYETVKDNFEFGIVLKKCSNYQN